MKEQIARTIALHKNMLANLEKTGIDIIAGCAQIIIDSIKAGGTIYICGNGGSAADAQHIAGELVGRFLRERRALPAVALSTDTSIITAIGNDYGFDNIFVRQVEALLKPADCLWAISTSGNSSNVVAAVELAKKRNAKIIAFTGKTDSRVEQLSDICLCAQAEKTFAAQEMHQLAYHIICDLVEQAFVKG